MGDFACCPFPVFSNGAGIFFGSIHVEEENQVVVGFVEFAKHPDPVVRVPVHEFADLHDEDPAGDSPGIALAVFLPDPGEAEQVVLPAGADGQFVGVPVDQDLDPVDAAHFPDTGGVHLDFTVVQGQARFPGMGVEFAPGDLEIVEDIRPDLFRFLMVPVHWRFPPRISLPVPPG